MSSVSTARSFQLVRFSFVSLTQGEGGAYHFRVAAFSTPAAFFVLGDRSAVNLLAPTPHGELARNFIDIMGSHFPEAINHVF
jgi:hypothetical protein